MAAAAAGHFGYGGGRTRSILALAAAAAVGVDAAVDSVVALVAPFPYLPSKATMLSCLTSRFSVGF